MNVVVNEVLKVRYPVVLIILLLSSLSVLANSSSTNQQNLDELITTLESDTARQELLADLKTLQQARAEEEAPSVTAVSDWLELEEQSAWISSEFLSWLESFGVERNGFVRILYFVITFFILAVWLVFTRFVSRVCDRKMAPIRKNLGLGRSRFTSVLKLCRYLSYLIGVVLLAYALAWVLGVKWDALPIFSPSVVLTEIFTWFFIVFIFVVIWEGANGLMEFSIQRHTGSRSGRIKTLLPIIRNVLLVSLSVLTALVVLSEIGIDIMPLLAGAGVLGIAIGFGAQTLVKDFLTGFTVILEDLLQIGDVVQVGNRTGVVERITIRKIQLRDLEGIVHTVPFGEISIVDNYTKEFSYYLFNVGVAYKEDTDKVIAHLKSIDETMRSESEFKDKMLGPIEILGVDEFADSAVIIKARVKTRAHDRWAVGREFNRRMKYQFDESGIEIPFPHRTVYMASTS